LFEKLKPTKNAPDDGAVQIVGVLIEQNEIHEQETTKSARKERRKEVTSALQEEDFRNDRLEKMQHKISAKGSKDKADNVTQKLDGIEDTPFIDGKTQCGKLGMDECTEGLVTELTVQECKDFLERQTQCAEET
jgi:hypothetical protein